ncbi:hypothetical protein TNCV_4284291 [Trichonephila clavipes]|uniref:Uncharacterized protein n=1 Tax=Trichonephila clavipes TaxID=2585209 RepID=A0A8X6SQT7_TRICX|nr:hypothetical protein TNCV_4284291 [Trichonephila clavipes]
MILQHWTKNIKRENPRTGQVGRQRERANQENRRRGVTRSKDPECNNDLMEVEHCIQLKKTVSGYTGFVEKKPGQSCSRATTSNRAGSSSFAASDKNEKCHSSPQVKKKYY